jgi:hypothetical protein
MYPQTAAAVARYILQKNTCLRSLYLPLFVLAAFAGVKHAFET